MTSIRARRSGFLNTEQPNTANHRVGHCVYIFKTLAMNLPSLALAIVCLCSCSPGNSEISRNLLTVEDVKGYYGQSFVMRTTGVDAWDSPTPGGVVRVETLHFMGPDNEVPERTFVTVEIRAEPTAQVAKDELIRVQTDGKKMKLRISDEAGLCKSAVSIGPDVYFVHNKFLFKIEASGLKNTTDQVESRTAALALAEKIVERLK